MNSHGVNILFLTTNRNGPMPTRFFCLFIQSLNDVSDLILYQPNIDPPGTKPHNLSLLFIVTKLLFRNISISFVKDTLYNGSS